MNNSPVATTQSIKAKLKSTLQSYPSLWRIYWRTKQEIKRFILLRFFFYDMKYSYNAMFWPIGQSAKKTLSAELLFQYHKLEKGLVMPGASRLFGIEPAIATMNLMARWKESGHDLNDNIFMGALETLYAYELKIRDNQLDPQAIIIPKVSSFLKEYVFLGRKHVLTTPYMLPNEHFSHNQVDAFDAFQTLAEARRSVRNFVSEAVVPRLVIEKAINMAQLSPSACNRQPCNVYIATEQDKKNKILALQNGNKGFGHLAPHIAIITADERCFFDASERHEPYIDGGLFAMSFILALRAQGVGSCCLNWCVPPHVDLEAHRLFNLDPAHRIIMLIAFGYAPEGCMVPRSPRRDVSEVLIDL